MRSIHLLSTASTGLSTEIKDNFPALTSGFTTFPQNRATPITTIFIYKYLSPQANLWAALKKIAHSAIEPIYVKLSNLEGVSSQTNEMRASA
ncbi:hypothetical protein MCEMRE196_00002 [Candidatus Nanopelagicaceae bacterium]